MVGCWRQSWMKHSEGRLVLEAVFFKTLSCFLFRNDTDSYPFNFHKQAFFALPSNIGVTATLNVAYKKPTFANQYVVIRAELSESKGRKAWVKARLEDLNGEVLVEAE